MTFCSRNTSSFLSNAFGKFKTDRAYHKIFCWWEICIICGSETPQIVDCRFFQRPCLWKKVSEWLPFLCVRASLKRFAFAFPFASGRKASPPWWGVVCLTKARDQPKPGYFLEEEKGPWEQGWWQRFLYNKSGGIFILQIFKFKDFCMTCLTCYRAQRSCYNCVALKELCHGSPVQFA